MKITPAHAARLEFLTRVTDKECQHLILIESADAWMEMRRLRNQMVHEYIEDLAVLASALRSGHGFFPSLVASARRCVAEARRLLVA